MLSVLFIEDDKDFVEGVMENLEYTGTYKCSCVGFEQAENEIENTKPHIIVLDLFEGNLQDPNLAGQNIHDFVWEKHFCPVVIFSAAPEACEIDDHPFLKSVKKGAGGAKKLQEIIQSFTPHVQAIEDSEEAIRDSFSPVMRYVAPYAFNSFPDETKRIEIIKRAGRRRQAALMDHPPVQENMEGWERYIFPPISDTNILLGDVLRQAWGDAINAKFFRIVLTPSCDLARSETRPPKVSAVLVAKCCPVEKMFALANIDKNTKPSKRNDLLRSLLNRGYDVGLIPFPSLSEKIPLMAANLRDLELIPVCKIGVGEDFSFIRVASVDSPFRELISWAYLQTACRPGMPNQNVAPWVEEIADVCTTPGTDNQ